MTLLASVNRVLRDLREDDVDTLTTEESIQSIVDSLNRAADRVLRSWEWSFLKRYDGFAFFPGVFTATGGGGNANSSAVVNLKIGSSGLTTSDVAAFTTNVRTKIRWTDDASFGNTSFILTDMNNTFLFSATMSQTWPGTTDATDAAFELYTHEYVLPSTVRQVLSISDQEGDIDLAFVDRDTDFDKVMIRPSETKSHRPIVAYVGGVYSTTTLNGAGGSTGEGFMIWPPPNRDILLQYTYLYQHAALSADTDTWEAVPTEHISLFETMALEDELLDNRHADPVRAGALRGRNEARLKELRQADRKQPRRRRAMRPYGASGGVADPWGRWATTEVPEPS